MPYERKDAIFFWYLEAMAVVLGPSARRTLPQLAEEIVNDSTDSESKMLDNGLDQEEFEKRIKIK